MELTCSQNIGISVLPKWLRLILRLTKGGPNLPPDVASV